MSSTSSPTSGPPEHASVELSRLASLPFAAAARTRRLPLVAYAGLLRCLATVYEALELVADGAANDALSSMPAAELRRLQLLHADLDAIAGRASAPIPEAELRAELLAERIRLWAEDNPGALLGVVAVLGSPTVALLAPPKAIARCFGFPKGSGTSFLARVAQGSRPDTPSGAAWKAVGALAADAATAAKEAAAALLAIGGALYPAGTRPLSQLARVVNPHAGNYSIPDDLREIRAALRAGARTWKEIPYYRLRFADRGREWTWSDSCWLAALATLEQKAIDTQIAWIGRLLGTRGMPQLLLEEHLHVLADELSAARPAERWRYARLSTAAGGLAEQRRSHIADDDAAAIAGAFDALDLGGPRDARLGAVLVAAVADEAAGVPQAVESVASWLADPERFSQAWADAVHATIGAARGAALKRRD